MKITKEKIRQVIKEEKARVLKEWGLPEFTPKEQAVIDAMENLGGLIGLMGQSNPDMTDDYIGLFRALQAAGLDTKAMAEMAWR